MADSLVAEGESAVATTTAVVPLGHETEGVAEATSLALPSDAQKSTGGDLPEVKRKRADDEAEEDAPVVPPGDEAEESKKSVLAVEYGAPAEGAPRHPLWKTSLCSYFRRQDDTCSHGDSCRYAHSEEELRPRPDNTWDPNSQRAKRLKNDNKVNAAAGRGGDGIPINGVEDALGCSVEGEDTALDKCLIGLPMKWTSDNLKNFLGTQGIAYKTAKKKKGMAVGFVGFSDLEQVKTATQELNEKSISGKIIKVSEINRRFSEKKVISTSSNHQRDLLSAENQSNKDLSVPTNSLDNDAAEQDNCLTECPMTKARSARDVVTPLANMPYSEQLEHKKNSLLQTLKRLTRNARKACPDGIPLPDWVFNAREIGGLPCKLEGILESPMTSGYRNKCEFSVGYSLEGKRTVGFMLGNFREGITAVMEPIDCPNVSDISCKYALIFQEFLQSSDLPVWNRVDNVGFWRQFTVREGRKPNEGSVVENVKADIAEVMLIVQVCTLGIDNNVINIEFKKMSEALARGVSDCSPPLPLTSLVVQDHTGISNAAPADCPLLPLPIPEVGKNLGSEKQEVPEARIHDYINNLHFSISPTAFFQVNTLAAEKLYSLAGDWANLSSDTLLFDVCCGTGTIGLTLAHRVGMVVGIEMNDSAVSDAKRNAEINGIKNCRFVCGKAEDVMGALLKEYLDMPLEENSELDISEENEVKSGTGDMQVTGAMNLHLDECSNHGGKSMNQNQHNDGSASISGEILDKPSDDASQLSCTAEDKKEASPWKIRNVVAIVDPPRGGLHPNVIKTIRTHPRLRHLVYISCNPESMVANAIELCTPTSEKPQKRKANRVWRNATSASLARHRTKSMPNSEPFRPVKAMAVDLFPHTPHCEMVMLLER